MRQTTSIAPPNSILFISGPKDFEIPDIARESEVSIWSTPTCVIVGCYTFCDGETEVTLCSGPDVDPRMRPRFDGMLKTPLGVVEVSTVEEEVVFRARIPTAETRVRIWSDNPKEPDHVIIGLG